MENIVVSLPGKPSQETLDLVRSFSSVLTLDPFYRLHLSAFKYKTQQQKNAEGKVEVVQQPIDPKVEADVNKDGIISNEPFTAPKDKSDLAWISEKNREDFINLDCTNAKSRAVASK